jgi:LmbE family N-acetylglucosaminyl deacetylase
MLRLALAGAMILALGVLPSARAMASPPQDYRDRGPQPDAARLRRDIERLSTVGRVLYVAAHPDDENTRLLAWLVGSQKIRAAYLSLTRGEGGQNLIGSEQAPLLGVIRTQELLAARRIDGAEQFFGNERDFGYSKTPEETLSIWGREAALGDVVWAIRRFQPDVIITRFSPEDRETHGHHTASAMLALEAFTAAADPKAYPEQLKSVTPWQAKRIVWNKGVFGPQKPGALDGFLKMDVGGFDPVLGETATETAARSRSMHKSQGFGASPQRGPALEYFKLLAGAPIQQSFLDDLDFTWRRVPGSEAVQEALAQARIEFDPEHPADTIPELLQAKTAMEALPDNPWKAEKLADLSAAIAGCAGLYLDATAVEPILVPGGEVKLSVVAINRSPVKWTLHSLHISGDETVIDKSLENNVPVTADRTVMLPKTASLSNPYWLVEDPSDGRWTVHDPSRASLPEDPPALQVTFDLLVTGQPVSLTRSVTYAWNDPVAGERRRPIEVLPPVTVNPGEPLVMFPDAAPKDVYVHVRATRGAVSGALAPQSIFGFAITPASQPFKLGQAGEEQVLTFHVRPPAALGEDGLPQSGMLLLKGTLDGDGGSIDRSVQQVSYPHIPIQTLTPLARVKLVRFEMKRALNKIGYIPGAGDEMATALRQVGYSVTVLNDEALAKQPLSGYQAIVVGVRAFNTNDRMPAFHQRLMDYVSGGGTLIVQYNTQNRISRITGPIGPWPFNISQDRVTEENAPVALLEPKHPFFQTPNRIGEDDFIGWVQERGLYFADTWDDHYKPLLSMNDTKEPPRRGSLLVGRFGKGMFVYTGLSFFRQLPAGVPGAFRLFANLLSHAH